MTVKPPSPSTLKKYGITYTDWLAMLEDQDGRCPCGRLLQNRICVDHYHIKGWSKMKPEERRKWLRGLTCWTCNFYFLRRGMTVGVALGLANYLQNFEIRRPR